MRNPDLNPIYSKVHKLKFGVEPGQRATADELASIKRTSTISLEIFGIFTSLVGLPKQIALIDQGSSSEEEKDEEEDDSGDEGLDFFSKMMPRKAKKPQANHYWFLQVIFLIFFSIIFSLRDSMRNCWKTLPSTKFSVAFTEMLWETLTDYVRLFLFDCNRFLKPRNSRIEWRLKRLTETRRFHSRISNEISIIADGTWVIGPTILVRKFDENSSKL